MERWNYSSLNMPNTALLTKKKERKGHYIYMATFNLIRDCDLIKLVICSASPIHIWRKQESMPNKTLSTAAKRKISMNGDNQQEQEKDQTWNRYPRLFKKTKKSVKLLRNFQQPSSSSTEESENLNLSSQ